MRITRRHAQENRERVIDAAAKLFRERGFHGAGVAELMQAAGLTHGGFYNHFESKQALEVAACARTFDAAVARIAEIADMAAPEARAAAFADYLVRYVSPQARDAMGPGCPMVAFATDVSRESAAVQKAFADGLARYVEAFARASRACAPDEASRREALQSMAMLVGALTLARSVAREAPELSDEILQAARAAPQPPGNRNPGSQI